MDKEKIETSPIGSRDHHVGRVAAESIGVQHIPEQNVRDVRTRSDL